MSSQTWDPNCCNDKSGFLFSHACWNPPTGECSHCGKPICDDHTKWANDQPFCASCVKREIQRSQRQGVHHGHDYHDPYFYGSHHYPGYGYYRPGYWGYSTYHHHTRHDPHDFTEADAESLAQETDEDFETEMDES